MSEPTFEQHIERLRVMKDEADRTLAALREEYEGDDRAALAPTEAEMEAESAALAAVLARLGEIENRSTWRPISEIHEDFGSCVLWNGDELRVGTNLDSDFDEADYLCFVPVPILTHVAVARLIDKMQPIEEIRAGLDSRADAQGED